MIENDVKKQLDIEGLYQGIRAFEYRVEAILAVLQEDWKRLAAESEKIRMEFGTKKVMVAELNEVIARKTAEIEDFEEVESLKRKSISEFDERIAILRKEIEVNLEAAGKEEAKIVEDLKKKISELSSQKKTLEDDIGFLRVRKDDGALSVSLSEEEKKKLENERVQAEYAALESEKRAKEKRDALRALEEKCDDLREVLKRLEQSRDGLLTENTELGETKKSILKDISDLEGRRDDKKKEVNDVDSQIERHKQILIEKTELESGLSGVGLSELDVMRARCGPNEEVRVQYRSSQPGQPHYYIAKK
jgi:chromosome segregation ATPase